MKMSLIFTLAAVSMPGILMANVVAFPARNQSLDQQAQDQTYCKGWAMQQSGDEPESKDQRPRLGAGTVKGAAGGAAAGAAMGQVIAHAPGRGAAAGAVIGAIAGRRAARRAARAKAAEEESTFDKAYAACMESKNYNVK